jgi:hypothetical protein
VVISEDDRARFLARVAPAPDSDLDLCWLWQGSIGADGVGKFAARVGGGARTLRANRVAWAIANGELDDRAQVLTCPRDARCCNPAHLAIVPYEKRTPLRRGEGARAESDRVVKPALTVEETRAALVACRGDLTRAARFLRRSRQRFAATVRRYDLAGFAAEMRRAARGFSGPGCPPSGPRKEG